MGMNPRGRSRGRNHNNFNNNRRFNNGPTRNTVYDSIGPAGRLRGTAFQLMEKYLSAAKELMSSDRVLAESCLQHADHYMRLNALAIAAENARFVQPVQNEAENAEICPDQQNPADSTDSSVISETEGDENVISFEPLAAEQDGLEGQNAPVVDEAGETEVARETEDGREIVNELEVRNDPSLETSSGKEDKLKEGLTVEVSVPVSPVVENEMKARRNRSSSKKASEEAGMPPVVKRRGRPPVKKKVVTEAEA